MGRCPGPAVQGDGQAPLCWRTGLSQSLEVLVRDLDRRIGPRSSTACRAVHALEARTLHHAIRPGDLYGTKPRSPGFPDDARRHGWVASCPNMKIGDDRGIDKPGPCRKSSHVRPTPSWERGFSSLLCSSDSAAVARSTTSAWTALVPRIAPGRPIPLKPASCPWWTPSMHDHHRAYRQPRSASDAHP